MTPLKLIEALADAGYWVKFTAAQSGDWVGPTPDDRHRFLLGYYSEGSNDFNQLPIRIHPSKFDNWKDDDLAKLLEFIDQKFRNLGFDVG